MPGDGLEVKAEETLKEGDYRYEVNQDGNVAIVEYLNLSGEHAVIPSEIDGKKVTDIKRSAFWCKLVTDVVIPDSVTVIEEGAFTFCSELTGVTIPNSVTNIDGAPFFGCSNLTDIVVEEGNSRYDSRDGCNAIIETESNVLIQGCKKTVIPSNVRGIGERAFSRCGLTDVIIPNSVTSIGDNAFCQCYELANVVIPNNVTSIGSRTFSECTGLMNVVIPNNVTSIGNCAFEYCRGLKSVSIPNSVTSIGDGAFAYCSGLTGVIIPNSVTSIGDVVFDHCSGLTKVTIPDKVTSIGNFAFYGCSGLTSVTIPPNVTSIGDGAFSGCSGLTSVTIPPNVTSIGDDAFSSCSGLMSVTIPSNVTSIEDRAFADCSGLTSVSIPDSVTSIGDGAFSGCSGLTGVTIPSSVKSIGEEAFGYYYDYSEDGNEKKKVANFTISGASSSAAEAYAKENGFTFRLSPDSGPSQGGNKETDISGASVTLSESSYPYDGTPKTPSVIVKLGEKVLVPDTDYTVTYSNHTNVGTATVTVTGKGNYTGSKTVNFTITKAAEEPQKIDISKADIILPKTSYIYDGKAKTPSVTVKLDGKTLLLDTDYTVTYSNHTNVGTATVTVTGRGSYTGSKSVNFTIVKAGEQEDSRITCKKTVYKVAYGAKPFKINAASKRKMVFTSSKPAVAAVDRNSGKVTVKNTGIAIITIKAGNTVKKVAVKVSPRKPSVKSAKTAKGRKLTVKWAKDKRASGYQVQISTDKKFKKNLKSKSLPQISCTFTKLKTGKKYYARIRSYKKSGKEKLYSAWSKAKLGGKVKK